MYASVGALARCPGLEEQPGKRSIWQRLCGEQSGRRIITSRAVSARRSPTPLPISTSGSTATPPPSFALAPAPNNTNTITSTCTGTTSSTNTRSNKHTSTNTGNSTGTDTSTNNSNSTTIPSIHVYAWDRFPLGIDCPHLFSLSVRVECPFLVVLCRVECTLCRVECPFSRVECPSRRVECPCLSSGGMPSLSGWNAPVCLRQRQAIGDENGHEKCRERLRVSRGAQASVEL